MSTEPQKELRQFCAASECPIWESIKQLEEHDDGSTAIGILRQICADSCKAYQLNRWLYMVNKEIRDKVGCERYTR